MVLLSMAVLAGVAHALAFVGYLLYRRGHLTTAAAAATIAAFYMFWFFRAFLLAVAAG